MRTKKVNHNYLLRAALMLRGLTIKDWALKRGSSPDLVYILFSPYWACKGKKPRGQDNHGVALGKGRSCNGSHGFSHGTPWLRAANAYFFLAFL